MKLFIIISTLFINSVFAETSLKFIAQINDETKELNEAETNHVFKNTVGYLNTCTRLEDVVGEKYGLEVSIERYERIKSEDHIDMILGKGEAVIPFNTTFLLADKIIVGFTKNQLPELVTIFEGRPQLYAKCNGYLAVINFKCDKVISNLFKLNSNDQICATHQK